MADFKANEQLPPLSALNHALSVALRAAQQGPRTGGNPQVGACLIAPDGQVISVGYHRGKGTQHAEPMALASAPVGTPMQKCTLLVTLEPCNHVGLTPACSRTILELGVGNVVYAVADPNPLAAGGADELLKAGINVYCAQQLGLDETLRRQAYELVKPWLCAVRRGRPWVIGKTAQSLDGFSAAPDLTSMWITNQLAQAHAHRVRASVDVIVVGTGTVLADNPTLTARTPSGQLLSHQPLRVIIGLRELEIKAPADGGSGVLSDGAQMVKASAPLSVGGVGVQAPDVKKPEGQSWKIEPCLHYRTHDLEAVLEDLYAKGARYVLVEGGPGLLGQFIREGLIDELHVYQAPLLLGDGIRALPSLGTTTLAEGQRWRLNTQQNLGDNQFLALTRPDDDTKGAGEMTQGAQDASSAGKNPQTTCIN